MKCVYVVVPHEFQAWGSPKGSPTRDQRARTIALCTENPGTEWFEQTYEIVAEFAAAVSINRSSAAELRRRGIPRRAPAAGLPATVGQLAAR